MRIKSLTLFSNDLDSQRDFYRNVLGFDISNESIDSFSVSVGWSTLTFKKAEERHLYHYCFLIPFNKFDEAYEWFSKRLKLISLDEETTFEFENWNAKSFYFYDGNGNIAECIVRYDLSNESSPDFSISDLLCINEIGTPTYAIEEINNHIEATTGSQFWKGDYERFGTNGDNEGLFLLVNSRIKKSWFPTNLPTIPSTYEATIETGKGLFDIFYADQALRAIKKVLLP